MTELLNVTLRLTPESSQRNLIFNFQVTDKAKKLHILYRYYPKNLTDDVLTDELIEEGFKRYILPEDFEAQENLRRECKPLVNLVTLSIDSPLGYIGAAHRHPNEQEHYIGGEETSPGFDPIDIIPGIWRAVISTHTVCTRECTVHLIVEEME